jgi:hypothetical protein
MSSKYFYPDVRNKIALMMTGSRYDVVRGMDWETEHRYNKLFDIKMQSGLQLIAILEEAIKDEIKL